MCGCVPVLLFVFVAPSRSYSRVLVRYANLTQVKLRFYKTDIELLFSTSPFTTSGAGASFITLPNEEQTVALPASTNVKEHRVALTDALLHSNVTLEAVAGALRDTATRYATRMHVSVRRNYGQVKVQDAATGKPLPRVYVKVYYRTSPGDKGQFYKDGHTDIRGVFDYAALNTDQLSRTQRFALLVMSDSHGAVVVETPPPSAGR